MTPGQPVAKLAQSAVRLLVRYRAETSTPARTELLRQLADLIVDLRAHFTQASGETDWQGRSPQYREVISSIYSEAGFSDDEERSRTQAGLRYHTSEALRKRIDPLELAKAGFTSASRKTTKNNARQALTAAVHSIAPSEDVPRLAAYAQALLDHVDLRAVINLSAAECVAARMALEEVLKRTESLLAALELAEAEQETRTEAPKRSETV